MINHQWLELFQEAKKLSKEASKLLAKGDVYYKKSGKLYAASNRIYRKMDRIDKDRRENDPKYPKVIWGNPEQIENKELEKKTRVSKRCEHKKKGK